MLKSKNFPRTGERDRLTQETKINSASEEAGSWSGLTWWLELFIYLCAHLIYCKSILFQLVFGELNKSFERSLLIKKDIFTPNNPFQMETFIQQSATEF